MISVIVPVYNVENYLDKCVQSIMAQTYREFELILVDDGSPDRCPQLCDAYPQMDRRVSVIHKANGGLSDARNVGVDQAKGEYVTFIDSDDFVSHDYLETLWNLLIKYNADIAVSGICTFNEDKKINGLKKKQEYCYDPTEALEHMLYQNTLDTSACAMLLPMQIVCDNPFPVGKYHEDEFTTYKYYSSVKTVAVTTRSQYFYCQRTGSIMHTFSKANMDELDAADNLVEFCEKNYPELLKAANSKKFSDYCQVLLSFNNLEKVELSTYQRITDYLKEVQLSILLDSKTRFKNRVAALLLLLGGAKLLRMVDTGLHR